LHSLARSQTSLLPYRKTVATARAHTSLSIFHPSPASSIPLPSARDCASTEVLRPANAGSSSEKNHASCMWCVCVRVCVCARVRACSRVQSLSLHPLPLSPSPSSSLSISLSLSHHLPLPLKIWQHVTKVSLLKPAARWAPTQQQIKRPRQSLKSKQELIVCSHLTHMRGICTMSPLGRTHPSYTSMRTHGRTFTHRTKACVRARTHTHATTRRYN